MHLYSKYVQPQWKYSSDISSNDAGGHRRRLCRHNVRVELWHTPFSLTRLVVSFNLATQLWTKVCGDATTWKLEGPSVRHRGLGVIVCNIAYASSNFSNKFMLWFYSTRANCLCSGCLLGNNSIIDTLGTSLPDNTWVSACSRVSHESITSAALRPPNSLGVILCGKHPSKLCSLWTQTS